jgi:DNA replication and repair protein RecF
MHGMNGTGKTSVLEAVGWLATQRSFRRARRETLVRTGAHRAIVRAETAVGERHILVEAEIPADGPPRTQVNRNVVRRRSQLAEALRVTVFSPEDLHLVQSGPALRREFLDDVLADASPRLEALVNEVDRILRHRGAVLRQAHGTVTDDIADTLEVWDTRLGTSGTALATERAKLADELMPLVSGAYQRLAATSDRVTLNYRRSWSGDLHDALLRARTDDVRRQTTSVGPHRDELDITIGARAIRSHASQGEQRSAALALRLATHDFRRHLLPDPPVLLLDDVFSELDPHRATALLELLPTGQVLLTTAVDPPAAVRASRVLEVTSDSESPVTGRR